MKNILLISILMLSLACTAQDQNRITIYGSNECDHCINLKKSLDSAKIEYVFYDVDVDQSKELEMIGKLRKHQVKGNISLPVVDLNDEKLLIGADYKKLSEALKE